MKTLGYNSEIEKIFSDVKAEGQEIARVISEHRERYRVKDDKGEYEAEIIGNLRYTATERSDFPAVGDWVIITKYDSDKALIHNVVYRRNTIKRKAVGSEGEYQIIATNVDMGFIVEAVNRDFNLNRYERYITICKESDIEPVLILNKTDLLGIDELKKLETQVNERFIGIKFILSSCLSGSGLDALKTILAVGNTYCFLGSSGVGKSTIINMLAGEELMATSDISESTDRGIHTTSHRELIVLKDGGVLMDNPGMRELGVTGNEDSLDNAFDIISEYARKCRFTDCTHEHEEGCAVLTAVNSGEIGFDSYKNYLKLRRETIHYQSSEAEKRKKGKDLAKMIKEVKSRKAK